MCGRASQPGLTGWIEPLGEVVAYKIEQPHGAVVGLADRCGFGVPERFPPHASSLVGKHVEFHSVFISYSSHDQGIADRLYADLQANGVRCWMDREDLRTGATRRTEIHQAIREHHKLLLLLSAASIASAWVEDEVEAALRFEQLEKRQKLFPIRLDDAVVAAEVGWPATVGRRPMRDFRAWQDEAAYKREFDRLLCGLKADPGR
jgi:hypothetical protein